MSDVQLRDTISRALVIACDAVDADKGGDLGKAKASYESAAQLLHGTLGVVNSAQGEKIRALIKSYTRRSEECGVEDVDYDTDDEVLGDITPEFLGCIPAGEHPKAPPSKSSAERAFWLMRVLAATMVEEGGFITPRIYVPQAVWYQTGARFTSMTAKFISLDTVLMYLLKLENEDVNNQSQWKHVDKELEEFTAVCDKIQNNLSRKLLFIPPSKSASVGDTSSSSRAYAYGGQQSAEKEKKKDWKSGINDLGRSVSRHISRVKHHMQKDKIQDDTAYIEVLHKVCMKAQILGEWMLHFETTSSTSPNLNEIKMVIIARIKRLSDFFHCVICAFLVRDFEMLMGRYMRFAKHRFLYGTL